MRQTSASVISSIDTVMDKCRLINEHQLIGFTPERPATYHHQGQWSERAELYSISLQIKMLAQLPELIWGHLDNDEFFIATQLFIFARHINTGLRLNKLTGSDGELIISRFPLIKNQWAILQQFLSTIKERCNARLETEDLSAEVAAKCLASLILLDTPTTIDSLLQTLINLRIKAFCDVLNDPIGKYSMVRDKLLASLTVLNSTVLLIHKCFVDQPGHPGGLLAEQLSRLSSENSPYTISHLSLIGNSKAMQFLPEIISKYRPNVSVNAVPLHSVHQMVHNWLKSLDQIAGTHVKSLVHLIGSVKVIRDIKETSHVPEGTPNWPEICRDLQLPENMNFYRQYYHHLINDRVKEIIESSWSDSLNRLTEDIHGLLDESTKTPQNLSKFMWTEEPADIPLSLAQALDPDQKKRKLLMKCLGYSPQVVQICTQFDRHLEALYKDVDNYIATREDHPRVAENKELRQDQEDLVKFLAASSIRAIRNVTTLLKQENKIQDKESFLQVARQLQAIRDLCPHLRLILCYRIDGLDLSAEENWILIGRHLEEESMAYWIRWADQYFAEWCVSNGVARPVDYACMLEEFGQWQSVVIEEKDEQENPVQSTIRVPAQASFRLQNALFRIATDLNKIAPHTIPQQIVGHLMERIAEELLKNYGKLNENDFVRGNQNVSLQFFFDVKYLTLLLVPRDVQNRLLPDQAQKLANAFKAQVDPFDFELFFAYLTRNVKLAAQRSQNQLGVIIPNMDHLVTVLGGSGGDKPTAAAVGEQREPNVLALSAAAVTWFPLLPIANPMGKETTGGGAGAVKKDEVRQFGSYLRLSFIFKKDIEVTWMMNFVSLNYFCRL